MNEFLKSYVVVTDYLNVGCGEDVSEILQRVIDENPNRTLFFPDGEYLIGKPVFTPAAPARSVSLKLADFAVIRAMDGWSDEGAMIRLGGKDPENDIFTPGSNYGLDGGIIDCRGLANGISIDGGRETYVRNTSIKNALIGLHIQYGANSGSSDADIFGVNITGTGRRDSVGVLIEGLDNTLTNMRIGNVFTGVHIKRGGNMLRNIHPLYYITSESYSDYAETVGFLDDFGKNNWYDFCYSDHFATGFRTVTGGGSFRECFAYWYSDREARHVAFESTAPFWGRINGMTVGGRPACGNENRFAEHLACTSDAVVRDVTVGGHLLSKQELLL